MADISQEIAAFQNAVYGEEVRSSMVSAIEKINDVCEDAESTVESFSSGVTTAISNANTAASAANTAASNANTKASAANTAATNANTARTAANNAATAANNAASAATATNTNITNAESARVTAEQARATAESARQANEQSRQTAETARVNAESARASAESSRASAESQRQSNENTRQGNETVRQTQEGLRVSAENSRVNEFEDMQAAFADMQRQIVPQATTNTMGGVIVGDGLNVDNALLSLATTKSGSGTAVASNGAVLESVVVYGQSDQDGTPTPSEPVDVQVVQGVNTVDVSQATAQTPNTVVTVSEDSVRVYTTANGSYRGAIIPLSLEAGKSYRGKVHIDYVSGSARVAFRRVSDNVLVGVSTNGQTQSGDYEFNLVNYDGTPVYLSLIVTWSTSDAGDATFSNLMLNEGAEVLPYTPYGSIGIVIGGTATPIDLQGNVLASLPDGTRDTVTVDGAGHCVLEKRVGVTVLNGSETWGISASGTVCYTAISGAKPTTNSNVGNVVGICNRFVDNGSYNSGGGSIGLTWGGTTAGATCRACFNNGTETSSVAAWTTWLASNNVTLYYPLAATQTIDLGYIDMPTIPEGATISVSASITPVIDASWWERGAEALASIVKAFSERIKALEEAVAELATA